MYQINDFVAGYCRAQDCWSRDYDHGGTVCVCNSDRCDTIPRPEKVEQPQLLIYTSNKAGSRFEQTTGQFEQSDAPDNQIRIDPAQKFQTILGWGGAFTDATGINIESLDEQLQETLLRSYFAEDGIEYSMCRVPIGGTDFSTHGYSYDDGDVDKDLVNFTLADEDHQYKVLRY
jgi:glucosylceramidase